MRIGNYSIVVTAGAEHADGYVEMTHDTQYALRLINHSSKRCDADVSIDGARIGCWRIRAKSLIEIERPSKDDGIFTFFECGSRQARDIGLVATDKTGLIRVVFKPEREKERIQSPQGVCQPAMCIRRFRDSDIDAAPETNFSPGGTGLSGKSNQKFVTVESIEYDDTAFVEINLRLVARKSIARPLYSHANRVPPAVS